MSSSYAAVHSTCYVHIVLCYKLHLVVHVQLPTLFTLGKASSGTHSWIGTSRLPNPAIVPGMMKKKIINIACHCDDPPTLPNIALLLLKVQLSLSYEWLHREVLLASSCSSTTHNTVMNNSASDTISSTMLLMRLLEQFIVWAPCVSSTAFSLIHASAASVMRSAIVLP